MILCSLWNTLESQVKSKESNPCFKKIKCLCLVEFRHTMPLLYESSKDFFLNYFSLHCEPQLGSILK